MRNAIRPTLGPLFRPLCTSIPIVLGLLLLCWQAADIAHAQPASVAVSEPVTLPPATPSRVKPLPEVGVAFGFPVTMRSNGLYYRERSGRRFAALAVAPVSPRLMIGGALHTGPDDMRYTSHFFPTPIWSTSLLVRAEYFLARGRIGSVRLLGAAGARHSSVQVGTGAFHSATFYTHTSGPATWDNRVDIEVMPFRGGWVPTTMVGLMGEVSLSRRLSLVADASLCHDLATYRRQQITETYYLTDSPSFTRTSHGVIDRTVINAHLGIRVKLNAPAASILGQGGQ